MKIIRSLKKKSTHIGFALISLSVYHTGDAAAAAIEGRSRGVLYDGYGFGFFSSLLLQDIKRFKDRQIVLQD